MTVLARAMEWAEQGRIPDFVIRRGIRGLVRARLDDLEIANPSKASLLRIGLGRRPGCIGRAELVQ